MFLKDSIIAIIIGIFFIMVQEVESKTYSDDFESYPSSTWREKPYASLNGCGKWTSNEWNIMRGEADLDGNYIMVRQHPPGPNNHATYHLATSRIITSLSVRFKYFTQSRCELSVYISPDGYDWTGISEDLGIYSANETQIASADLSYLLSDYNQDIYVRFKTDASSGDYWMSAIDDFSIEVETSGEILMQPSSDRTVTTDKTTDDWEEWEYETWIVFPDYNIAIQVWPYLDSLKIGRDYNYEWEYFLVCNITARALSGTEEVDFYNNFYLTDSYDNRRSIGDLSGPEFYEKLNPGRLKWAPGGFSRGDKAIVGSRMVTALSRKVPFSIAREEITGTQVNIIPHIDYVRFTPKLSGVIYLHYKSVYSRAQIYNFDRKVKYYQRQRTE